MYTSSGTKIGSYTYDAWGNCTYTYAIGATTAQKKIVNTLNPFRYRGYYYDTETSLYYLQSRYYNPATGRFINADGYVNANGDLIGFNMYAYCGNNPVMNIDPTGDSIIATLIIGAVVGAALGAGFDFLFQMIDNGGDFEQVDYKSVGKSAISGAVSGLMGSYFSICGGIMASQVTSKGLQVCYRLAGNIIGGGIANVMGDIVVGDVTCLEDALPSFISGFISGSISEGLCYAAKGLNILLFNNASRATQKSILTNKVFKEGDFYYNWTWKGYSGDVRFANY